MQTFLNSALRLAAFLPALLLVLFAAGVSLAAEPAVRNLNVRGLQSGGTTTPGGDGDFWAGAKHLWPCAAER